MGNSRIVQAQVEDNEVVNFAQFIVYSGRGGSPGIPAVV